MKEIIKKLYVGVYDLGYINIMLCSVQCDPGSIVIEQHGTFAWLVGCTTSGNVHRLLCSNFFRRNFASFAGNHICLRPHNGSAMLYRRCSRPPGPNGALTTFPIAHYARDTLHIVYIEYIVSYIIFFIRSFVLLCYSHINHLAFITLPSNAIKLLNAYEEKPIQPLGTCISFHCNFPIVINQSRKFSFVCTPRALCVHASYSVVCECVCVCAAVCRLHGTVSQLI